jgi:transcriptional regulator
MYSPDYHLETRQEILLDAIDAIGFGILIGYAGGQPLATHLPFLLDRTRGDKGVLVSHMARANPHWQIFDGKAQALVAFSGPHGYISPRWYQSSDQVPTWNYVAVHCTGAAALIDDTLAHLGALADHMEKGADHPWSIEQLPQGKAAAMAGKIKLSQNRTDADRAGVIAALQASDAAGDQELAAAMQAALTPDP